MSLLKINTKMLKERKNADEKKCCISNLPSRTQKADAAYITI